MDNETSQQNFRSTFTIYLDILRRRRSIVLQTFIVVVAVGILVTSLTKPLYRTSASILIEGKTNVVTMLDPSNPLSNLFSSDAGHEVDTQLQILQGEKVLEDTYKEADLPPGSVVLEAKQSGATDIIDLTTISNVRDYARKFANTLPIVYRRVVTGNRSSEIKNALEFARQRLLADNQSLARAEAALQAFYQRSHISNLETERAQRTTRQVTAEADRDRGVVAVAGIQARLDALLAQHKSLHADVVNPVSATNPALQTLQNQIDTLKLERAKALLLYKPAALEVRQLDLQIQALQERLAQAPSLVKAITRSPNPALALLDEKIAETYIELAEARAKLANTRQIVSGGSQEMDRTIQLERQQARLERDIARYESSVALLTRSVDDLSLRNQATHDPVLVISPAGRAAQIAPRRLNNLLIATVAGLVLALTFAFIQEMMDDGINSPDDLRRILGVPVLGFIPLVDDSADVLLGSSPGGMLLETYRVLRANVRFSAVDAPIRSIAVTSTVAGEGKSVTVHNLAVAMALDGRRVIVVDANLRRPTQHKYAGLERSPGLTNVLVANMEIEEALQSTQVDNLCILTTGPLPPNPTELLNSQAMAQFYQDIQQHCDIVIYDTPACLGTADAQLLAAAAEGVLYVAQFGVTKGSLMRRSAEILQLARARMLGSVFNKVVKPNPLTGLCLILCLFVPISAFGQTKHRASPTDYTLGAEDVIEISVQNHADLNRLTTILPDGTITVPPIGEIHASGLTPRGLASQLQAELEKTYNNCPVLVAVKEIHSRRVRILGAIRAPGGFDLKPNWRLIDLVAAAGGLPAKPEAMLGRVVRQGGDIVSIDIARAMANPESEANCNLQVDDLVLLDEKPRAQVFVTGQVNRPGAYDLTENATVLSVLSQAGNLTDLAALTKAYILRGGAQIPIDLHTVLISGQNENKVLQRTLQAGDLLFIPTIDAHYSVMGQITRPGSYALPETEPRTVLQGLNLAGGLANGGDFRDVGVIRTINGKTSVIRVNADRLLRQGSLSQDIALKNGDILYVPARRQGHAFQWQDLLSPLSLLSVMGVHF